jgi:hypothetical protein
MTQMKPLLTLVALAILSSPLASALAQNAPMTATSSVTAAAPKPKPAPLVPPTLANYTGAPFGGKAQTIPGRIEVENYDEGGHGVAYFDRTPDVNSGAGYRKGEGVDIKGMVLPPGKKSWYKSNDGTPTVGWFFIGEWMHYTVDVTAGAYDINVRYATPIADKALEIHLDGILLASVPTPKTGEYTIWKTATFKNVAIEARGRHLLRVQAAGKDLDEDDINWIEFVKTNP